MAQKKHRVIERNSQVRYTDEVIEGNTVRSVAVMPERAPQEYEYAYREQVRERALSMNFRYVLFLTCAAVAVVAICINYLKLQAVSTKLQKKTVVLQTQLKELQIENDIVYSEIGSGVDLEQVRDTAINHLGMTYPSEEQIVSYDAVSSDYVKQYEEIPE